MLKSKIFKYLEKVENGYLEIITPENNKIEIGNQNSEPKANIKIKDWQLVERVLAHGDIGLGEAYIENLFETDDLINLLCFFVVNQKQLEGIFHGNLLASFIGFLRTLFNKNTITGSKKNISYHYDTSNDFFSLWLDESMTYSSGIFVNETDSLFASQQNKYGRILKNLNGNGASTLEIGCGWGGFLEYASSHNQKIKALTISNEQARFAEKRLKAKNLNAEIAIQDYRHETGKFDNIVSIEMFEAVGKEYWNTFFAKIKSSLENKGIALIQTITIDHDIFNKYAKTSDFIRKHIFPGGFLPSEIIFENLAKTNELQVTDKFCFASSYYKTLKIWLNNFNHKLDDIRKMNFDERFIRKWQFYLAYCAAGFYGRRTNVVQYCLTKS
jgi:cyclopropane-fatty-acyl-phospholipid synthase